MTSRSLVYGILCVVVGASAAWTTAIARTPKASVLAETKAHESSQEATIRALEDRLEALERRPTGASPTLAPPIPPAAESATSADLPAPGPPPPRQVRTAAELDALVAHEGRDRGWADKYERDMTGALQAEFKEDHVREARCATSVCRVVIAHTSEAGRASFTSRFWSALPEGYAVAEHRPQMDSDGTPTTVLHVVRKGYEAALVAD